MATCTRSRALRLLERTFEFARYATDEGEALPVAAAVHLLPTGIFVPAAHALMDGAKPISGLIVLSKNRAVLAFGADTADLLGQPYANGQDGWGWNECEELAARGEVPQLVSWGGGIQLFDQATGELVGALAVAGRTPRGNHRLAMWAAALEGFRTQDELNETFGNTAAHARPGERAVAQPG